MPRNTVVCSFVGVQYNEYIVYGLSQLFAEKCIWYSRITENKNHEIINLVLNLHTEQYKGKKYSFGNIIGSKI